MSTMTTTVPHIRTSLPGPKAKAIIERDGKVVSPSYTRDYPLVIARGEGAVVEDVDGNVFLDCTAGIAVTSTGHSHPDVVQAIIDQARKFLHMSGTDFYYEPQVRLGEELSAIAPMAGPHRSFFGNSGHRGRGSGAQAGEVLHEAPQRHRLSRRVPRPFDGIALGHGQQGHAAERLLAAGAGHVSRAVPGRAIASPGSADACAAECLSFIENQLFVHLVAPDEVAAILVEPIQGEGGYLVAAGRLPPGAARHRQSSRHRADCRRGAVGHGAHRADVRDSAHRRRAGRRHDRQGDRVGPAARRRDGAVGGDVVAARLARQHVRREPRGVRGGAGHHPACCATRS